MLHLRWRVPSVLLMIVLVAGLCVVVILGTLLDARVRERSSVDPAMDQRQRDLDAGDARALESLRDAGSDLSQPHVVEHYLYFPERSAADRAAGILVAEGYAVDVRPAADGSGWLCLAKRAMTLSVAALRDARMRLDALAQADGGEYDGWEAGVVR